MIADRDGARDVGAHVGAALALGHAHAQGHAVLLPPRQGPRIVGAGLDPGQPLGEQRGLGAQRADAGMGHGDGAHVPALGLGREIEPHGARRDRARLVAAVVRRGVDAVADALGHHGVIGGMELDQVQPVALAVHEVELGRVLVGDAAEIERGRRTVVLAAGGQVREVEPGTRRGIRQRPVGAEQVDIAERRRLVERGVFEQAGGHRASLVRRCRRGKPASGRRRQRQLLIACSGARSPCSDHGHSALQRHTSHDVSRVAFVGAYCSPGCLSCSS